jgi:cysteinyl-tRNA synthetase
MERLDSVLKVMHCVELELDENACRLSEDRAEARLNERWDEADRLRQALLEIGIKVVDTPEGIRWKSVE